MVEDYFTVICATFSFEISQSVINIDTVSKAQNKIDSPIAVKPDINSIWYINYGRELQGLVITNQDIGSHYHDIHTALVDTFLNSSYAILILEGYMMALVKNINNLLTRIPDPIMARLLS